MDLTFSVEEDQFGVLVTIDLKPNGRDLPVTDENKMEYIELVVQWRIGKRVEEQKDAFLEGFYELIPSELIGVFDEKELEVGCLLLPKSMSLTRQSTVAIWRNCRHRCGRLGKAH